MNSSNQHICRDYLESGSLCGPSTKRVLYVQVLPPGFTHHLHTVDCSESLEDPLDSIRIKEELEADVCNVDDSKTSVQHDKGRRLTNRDIRKCNQVIEPYDRQSSLHIIEVQHNVRQLKRNKRKSSQTKDSKKKSKTKQSTCERHDRLQIANVDLKSENISKSKSTNYCRLQNEQVDSLRNENDNSESKVDLSNNSSQTIRRNCRKKEGDNVLFEDGDIIIRNGKVDCGNGRNDSNIFSGLQSGQTDLQSGLVDLQNGQTDLLTEHIKSQNGQIGLHNGQVDLQNGQTDLLTEHIESQNGQIGLHNGQVDLQNGQTDLLTEHIESQNGQTDLLNGQVDLQNGQSDLLSGKTDLQKKDKLKNLNKAKHTSHTNKQGSAQTRSTQRRPLYCEMCPYSCHTMGDLRKHQRCHSIERRYKCDRCPYSCKISSNLSKHMRTHNNHQPYHCHHCHFRSKFASSLKVHLRSHTNERPFSCFHCSYTCSHTSNLKKHISRMHPTS